jgi:hypothetical protein
MQHLHEHVLAVQRIVPAQLLTERPCRHPDLPANSACVTFARLPREDTRTGDGRIVGDATFGKREGAFAVLGCPS